ADAGHVHVDQCDIRIQSFDACQAWRAIIGFGDHFHVRLLVDDQAQTGAYQRMVVDQYDPDHFPSPLILPVGQRYCAAALRTSRRCEESTVKPDTFFEKTFTWVAARETGAPTRRDERVEAGACRTVDCRFVPADPNNGARPSTKRIAG